MTNNNWMVGAGYSSPKLEEHLEQLKQRDQRVQEHKVEFLSRLLEYQVLKDEKTWRKKHPSDL